MLRALLVRPRSPFPITEVAGRHCGLPDQSVSTRRGGAIVPLLQPAQEWGGGQRDESPPGSHPLCPSPFPLPPPREGAEGEGFLSARGSGRTRDFPLCPFGASPPLWRGRNGKHCLPRGGGGGAPCAAGAARRGGDRCLPSLPFGEKWIPSAIETAPTSPSRASPTVGGSAGCEPYGCGTAPVTTSASRAAPRHRPGSPATRACPSGRSADPSDHVR